MRYTVTIPNWEASYLKSENTRAKYWLWKDRAKLPKKYSTILSPKPLVKGAKAYCVDEEGNRFVKNTKKVGTANRWVLNGQDKLQKVWNATKLLVSL